MGIRSLTLLFMPALLMCLSVVPNVHAQTTMISDLRNPTHAVMQVDGFTHPANVSFTVSYTGLPAGDHLMFGVLYGFEAEYPPGSASSTPDQCYPKAGTIYANSAVCDVMPSLDSGRESASFSIIFNSTTVNSLATCCALVAFAFVEDQSFHEVPSSLSTSGFAILVTDRLTLLVATAPNSVTVTIDGNQTLGIASISLPPGEMHMISVPEVVQLTGSSRLVFDHWSDGSKQPNRTDYLADDTNLTALYATQYALTLTDPIATGSGWYYQGSVAQISVPSSEPSPGAFGSLGGTQKFQGWYENGQLVSESSRYTITMNRPHTLDTHWAANDAIPLGILLLVVVALMAVAFICSILRRNSKDRESASARRERILEWRETSKSIGILVKSYVNRPHYTPAPNAGLRS